MNLQLAPSLRGRHLLAIDVVCVVTAYVLAFALRLDAPSDMFSSYMERFAWLVLPLVVLRVGMNLSFRLYQRLWRYASVEEMQAIVLATSAGSLLFGVLLLALSFGGWDRPASGFPRSIVGIEWLLSTAFLGGSRFSLRVIRAGRWVAGQRLDPASPESQRVLIVGAGDAGAMVARELQQRPSLGMRPIGFVDDNPDKASKWIHGIRVAGNRASLPDLVTALKVSGVIVAMPTAPGTIIRDLMRSCERLGVRVLTVPGIAELLSGKVAYTQIRPVQLEDLLRREPAALDLESVAGFMTGATVLVTGAGGSIGSELCRQILGFRPDKLLMLGRGENSIYQAHMEMLTRPNGHAQLVPVIADVRDMPRLKSVMAEHRPSVVFHAAAHKHVPLMESNPTEAVATNVLGTWNVLSAAADIGVETFVLVSTDKAVNPTSIMGATKRVAELLLQQKAAETGHRYVAVRFGNVLGSRGSVVPLFKQQIEAGGPVTVTHREVTRYFMTIPEAVQLIIQASALGQGGEIFVLDMGDPIRIYDLALDLIRLSGLEPGRDVDIRITGLRPGEKMHEELFTGSEERIATRNSRIFVSSIQASGTDHLQDGLMELSSLIQTGSCSVTALRSAVARLVPEFQHTITQPDPAIGPAASHRALAN